MIHKSITVLITFLLLLSCGKSTQECAAESLVGEWNVTKVIEVYNALNSSTQILTVDNPMGHFSISSDMMDYEYKVIEKIENTQGYKLEVTKENAGFTSVDVFTINGDTEKFRVRFGDETSDAHENATEMTLEQIIVSDTSEVNRIISLVRE